MLTWIVDDVMVMSDGKKEVYFKMLKSILQI